MTALSSLNARFRYRLNQIYRHLDTREDAETDLALRTLLPPEQWNLVARLSPADRNHLLNVHQELLRLGYTDPDLLTAALLHDVGKADERGRVRLIHRILKVLLEWLAPDLLRSLMERDGGWVAHGMYLALHHPELGARLARETGASERACWLIAHHSDDTIQNDRELTALQAIDERM